MNPSGAIGGPSQSGVGGLADGIQVLQAIPETINAMDRFGNTVAGWFGNGNNDKKREQRRYEEKRKSDEEQERKKKEEARQKELELINQKIHATENSSEELMADTKKSLEENHQNFLETKTIMEDTHQMGINMVKVVAGATAKLYHDLGYLDNNRNEGVHLRELAAAPNSHQMEGMQSGQPMDEQGPIKASGVTKSSSGQPMDEQGPTKASGVPNHLHV